MKNSDEEHLIVGNYYKVPCLVKEDLSFGITAIIPIYDNYHNDVESLQEDFHYHVDFRFIGEYIYVKTKKLGHILLPSGSRYGREGFKKETWILQAQRDFHTAVTPNSFISKVTDTLKGKKLKNCKKCPHKGYSLGGVKEHGGIKQCPLHGLKIDVVNKVVI